MPTLRSLDDLRSLLSDDEQHNQQAEPAPEKLGYDGRPQRLDVRLDSKKRRGKTVTLVTGFQSSPEELERITRELKKRCGAGGAMLDNAIEIQGDHRDRVIATLTALGFSVRR